MHLTRNQAYLHGYRGFKSLSLRQQLVPEHPRKSKDFSRARSFSGFFVFFTSKGAQRKPGLLRGAGSEGNRVQPGSQVSPV